MGNEGDHHLELSYFCTIKVHSLMCLELRNVVGRVSRICSSIESARPRCSTGLKALCSLHNAMDKGKQLLLHCSESSKLYLALTSDRILLKCESIRNSLAACLAQIQTMVPTLLAAKISGIVEDLRDTKFVLEPSEQEAGKVMRALLMRDIPASDTVNEEEFEALQVVAVRLNIMSPLAVLIEKRSIKKLHDRIRDTDPKRKTLRYLLYLLRKYADDIGQLHTKDDHADLKKLFCNQTHNSARTEPPLEFKCPISMRIMYDPVIIASGKTYERVWIQKWFSDGNNTCPVTQVRLENWHLTPNVAMKSLISKWCSEHGITILKPSAHSSPDPVLLEKSSSFQSIDSVGSSLNNLHLQVSNVSLQSSDVNPPSDSFDDDSNPNSCFESTRTNAAGHHRSHLSVTSRSISLAWISKLDSLSWDSQCKAVQDVKVQIQKTDKACELVSDDNYMKPLIQFLKNAHDLGDVNAQNDSADVILSILYTSRTEMPPFDENAIYVLTSLFDSEITEKALAIMEVLSCQSDYMSRIIASGVLPTIVKVLEAQTKEFCEGAMKILFNLSCNRDIAYHIVYLGYIPKLVPFLGDKNLAGYCLGVMNIVCDIEEGRHAIAGTNSCIASIAALVESSTAVEQEAAMQVLLCLSYEHKEQCLHILPKSMIQALLNITVNGNPRGKAVAAELVQILEQKTEETDSLGSNCTTLSSGLNTDSSSGSSNNQTKRKKSHLKRIGNLGRRISRFFLHNH